MKRVIPLLLSVGLLMSTVALAGDESCCKPQAACCQPAQECCTETSDASKNAGQPEETAQVMTGVQASTVETHTLKQDDSSEADCCAEGQPCCVEGADCCSAG